MWSGTVKFILLCTNFTSSSYDTWPMQKARSLMPDWVEKCTAHIHGIIFLSFFLVPSCKMRFTVFFSSFFVFFRLFCIFFPSFFLSVSPSRWARRSLLNLSKYFTRILPTNRFWRKFSLLDRSGLYFFLDFNSKRQRTANLSKEKLISGEML